MVEGEGVGVMGGEQQLARDPKNKGATRLSYKLKRQPPEILLKLNSLAAA